MDFDKELERIACQYRNEGYSVVTHPAAETLPAFATHFGAEILATRADESVLVRVKRDRSSLETDSDLPRQADVTNAQPGWRYDLVVLEPDTSIKRATRMVGEPKAEQIGHTLDEAEQVLTVSPRAALVLAWGGLEAALRRTAQRAGVGSRSDTQPTTLVRELYATGRISPEDFRCLEATRLLRNEVVHGLGPPAVDVGLVQTIVGIARRHLAEAEGTQAVAG
jgi:hypothetical protein